MLLAPSILASDFTDLKSEIKKIEEGGADLIHKFVDRKSVV